MTDKALITTENILIDNDDNEDRSNVDKVSYLDF